MANRLHTDGAINSFGDAMQLCFAEAEADSRLGCIPMADAVAAQFNGAATRRASGRHTPGKVGVDKDV